jgi:hypothetical protein
LSRLAPFLVALSACAAATNQTTQPDLSAQVAMDMALAQDGAAADLARPADLAGLFCTQACVAPQACCVIQSAAGTSAMCTTQSACPDGGVFAACTAPSQCTGATPSCCVTVNLMDDPDAGSSATGALAQCTASCPGGLIGSEFKTKLCENASQCVGYTGNFGLGDEPFNGCCNSARAPAVYFCAPTAYAGPMSYSCL